MALADQLAQLEQQYSKNAYGRYPGGNELVYKAFKDTTGRAPTEDEFRKYAAAATGNNVDLTGMIANDQAIQKQGAQEQQAYQDFAKQQEVSNASRRTDLAKLLSNQADTLFSQNAPSIAEDANAKGIYTGTGYGEALAREKANLATNAQQTLALQGLSDVDATNTLNKTALDRRFALDEAGTSRDFSLQDYARQATLAQQLGQLSQPGSGKGGGGGALAGGAAGASAGAAFGPWGAGIGGVSGALLGGLSKRKGGGK